MKFLEWMEEWQHFDWAAFHLGVHLGLWQKEEWQKNKWRWWVNASDDDLGTCLLEFLDMLAEKKFLEFNGDEMCYRRVKKEE